jgi:hypothetical protein
MRCLARSESEQESGSGHGRGDVSESGFDFR